MPSISIGFSPQDAVHIFRKVTIQAEAAPKEDDSTFDLEHSVDAILEIGASGEKKEPTCWERMVKRRLAILGVLITVAGIAFTAASVWVAYMYAAEPTTSSSDPDPDPNWPHNIFVPKPDYTLPPVVSPPTLPPTVAPTQIQTQQPTKSAASPISSPTQAPIAGPPVYTSILQVLSDIVEDPDQLSTTDTALGLAHQWIANTDDRELSMDSPDLVQRFLLAAFYFSTGGGRLHTTWDVCGAVPTVRAGEDHNIFSTTRCIMEGGETICAPASAFEDCPEYYERYNQTKPLKPKKRWLSESSECDWYGVHCNVFGRAVQVSLPRNGLQGSLLPELDLLEHLKTLDLGGNSLMGPLPAWGRWMGIQNVFLYNNQFNGTIPASWMSWRELTTLDLAENELRGDLRLGDDWMNLKVLLLNDNHLEVTLASELGLLGDLQVLNLSGNHIGDRLHSAIAGLNGLVELNLSGTGMVGSLPDHIGVLTNLVELNLDRNMFIGSLPIDLWNLNQLEHLNLGTNQFTGTLSTRIGNLVNLRTLLLDGSGLSGSLPETLGQLSSLEEVHLQFNSFTGTVPAAICLAPSLFDLAADCSGGEAVMVGCSCCTKCCTSATHQCAPNVFVDHMQRETNPSTYFGQRGLRRLSN